MDLITTWTNPSLAYYTAIWLLIYLLLLAAVRYSLRGGWGLLDLLWGCNVAMMIAAYGLFTHNSTLVGTGIAISAFPHLLWCVDVGSYLLTGVFPIGSAQYVTWPSTPVVEIYTTLHHVWLIPLLLWCLRGNGGMPWTSLPWAITTTAIIGLIARFSTPLQVQLWDGSTFYMNVNMSHEFWREVKGGILDVFHIADGQHWLVYHAWLNLAGVIVNTLPQAACVLVSQLIEPGKL